MTPQTRKVLPPELLDFRVGSGTLAGALNEQVRVRIEGTGPPSTRKLIPDNDLTKRLWETPAGTRLETQLRGSMSLLDGVKGTKLRGFTLNADGRGMAAAAALAHLEDEPHVRGLVTDNLKTRPQLARETLGAWADEEKVGLPDVAAWNNAGWIALSPSLSRVMLTDAGAYRPKPSESAMRTYDNDGDGIPWLRSVLPHELQHSVTQVTDKFYDAHGWIEEGLADTLSEPQAFQREAEKRMDLSPQKHAGRLAHAPTFDVGWKAWKKPTFASSAQAETESAEVDRNYVQSQELLTGFLGMAGAQLHTKAGRQRTAHLLQDKSAQFVPGALADAIIEHNHLDPSRRSELRNAILTSIDTPDALRSVREGFGIDS
jgi:hypothetical protein